MIKAAYDLAKQREAVDLTVRGRHRRSRNWQLQTYACLPGLLPCQCRTGCAHIVIMLASLK